MTQTTPRSVPAKLTWLRLSIVVVTLATISLCLLAFPAQADVPMRIDFQGFANDEFDQPFTGTATIGLSLWDDPFAGAQVFSETHTGVSVVNGLYGVEIGGGVGDTLDADVFSGTVRWVEVSVNGNPLAPRQQLLSVPYALFVAAPAGKECISPFKLLGLTGSGKLLCGDPNGGRTRASVDRDGIVGSGPAIAIAADGFPIISYFDATNQDLKLIHCTNSLCTSHDAPVTLDSAGDVGANTSIAIGADGFPLISYSAVDTPALKVIHCTNTFCTSADTPATLVTSGTAPIYSSLAIGTDGFPVITYSFGMVLTHALSVVHCTSIDCASNDAPIMVESDAGPPHPTTIAVGTDTLPVISYHDNTNARLMFVRCSNATCSALDAPLIIDSNGFTGNDPSLTIGTDGFPVMSYSDFLGNLWVLHCTANDCTSFDSPTNVDSLGNIPSISSSIAIGIDGFPVISYDDPTPLTQKLVHCTNIACTSFDAPVVLDSSVDVGRDSRIAIGEYGLPVVSYHDTTYQNLKVATCKRFDCTGI